LPENLLSIIFYSHLARAANVTWASRAVATLPNRYNYCSTWQLYCNSNFVNDL